MTEPRPKATDGGSATATASVGRNASAGTNSSPSADATRGGERVTGVDQSHATDPEPALWRQFLRTTGYAVLAFVTVGLGFGLAANFTIGFLIESFVEPGANPMDNTLVGIVLIVAVVNTFLLGPVVAAVTGLVTGRSLPDRRLLAAAANGTASVVGFYLLAGLALFVTFTVLSQYAPAEAASASGGAGGSSGGPFSPADLVPTLLEVGIPTGVVGAVTGWIGSRLA